MKIGLFASAYHPHLGGVEELCRQLTIEYRRLGVQVIVLTNRWPRSIPEFEIVDGTEVFRVPFRFPDGSVRSWMTYQLTHRAVQKKLCGVLRDAKVDLLHVQCVNASTAYAMKCSRALKIPLVVSTQGERTMDASGLFQRSRGARSIFRKALKTAHAVTACSADTLRDVRAHFELSNEIGTLIYNGVRVSDFAGAGAPESHRKPYVLAIGRLVKQKGFDVLIRAWAKARIDSLDLVLAGDGYERTALEKLAAELHVSATVRFFGLADRPAAIELFCSCTFFVLPSRLEPLGIVNLEAMAAGKAVIATRTGGVPELIDDGKTGILVPPDDVDALASAITALAGDPLRAAAMGSAGRQRAAAFDWSFIARQYRSIYESVLS